jgi:hypothetical protein
MVRYGEKSRENGRAAALCFFLFFLFCDKMQVVGKHPR